MESLFLHCLTEIWSNFWNFANLINEKFSKCISILILYYFMWMEHLFIYLRTIFFLMWTFWFISFGHFYIQLFISLSISKNPVCIRNIFSLIWKLFFFFFSCLLTLLIIFITKNIKKIFLSSSVYLWLYPESTWKSTLSHVDFGFWVIKWPYNIILPCFLLLLLSLHLKNI